MSDAVGSDSALGKVFDNVVFARTSMHAIVEADIFITRNTPWYDLEVIVGQRQSRG